jgi:2-hydroxymuconate-semialdehyde hydrolase
MLHGRDDAAFPPSSSVDIARRLPHADLILLSDCSHSVAVERTATFLALAQDFFGRATSMG